MRIEGSTVCECGHTADQHSSSPHQCRVIECACSEFRAKPRNLYEALCQCGHYATQHSLCGPRQCTAEPCPCSRYRALPGVLERVGALEAQYREMREVLMKRLDKHSEHLAALADGARARDIKIVRDALHCWGNRGAIEALERLLHVERIS